jgi:hypothetical protein
MRQIVRLCSGWTNEQLIRLVEQMADSGRLPRFSVAELVRRATAAYGARVETMPWDEMTPRQQRAEMLRRRWARATAGKPGHADYAALNDEQLLQLDEQQTCKRMLEVYGRILGHRNWHTMQHVPGDLPRPEEGRGIGGPTPDAELVNARNVAGLRKQAVERADREQSEGWKRKVQAIRRAERKQKAIAERERAEAEAQKTKNAGA